jgi:hypothetical protein
MRIYLTSFSPLCSTDKGLKAISKYDFPSYIDGSCRREPDFQNKYPAITGLCRPEFAKKLEEGYIVIYSTNKRGVGKRMIVAVLEVINMKSNHEAAASWYKEKGVDLPNNLMVDGTTYYPLDQTHELGKWGDEDSWGLNGVDIEGWNQQYIDRAKAEPKVAICRPLFLQLSNPIIFEDDENIQSNTRYTKSVCGKRRRMG